MSLTRKLGIGCAVAIVLAVVAVLMLRYFVQSNLDAGSDASQAGRYDDAIEHFKAVLAVNPDFAPCHEALASAYYGKHQARQAIEEMKAAVRLEPRNTNYHDEFANLYMLAYQRNEQVYGAHLPRDRRTPMPDESAERHGFRIVRDNNRHIGYSPHGRQPGPHQISIAYSAMVMPNLSFLWGVNAAMAGI